MSAPAVTAARLTQAYRVGEASPVKAARAALDLAARAGEGDPPLGAFVAVTEAIALAAAAESAARYRAGAPLGPLDGVPVAVKDMADLTGLPTTDGTHWRRTPARADAVVIARLRAAGAVIVGKTSLHEIGLGGTGINPGHITARNPWDRGRMTGGSSSGSGAAVAAGIVPVALGSDAGGSIRIPAALCGVYGLKPTFGRIPSTGTATLCWSLDHMGPLGASVGDLAAFYLAVAGPDGGDEASLHQPAPEGPSPLPGPGLAGIRIAWCPRFADDADPPVRRAFHDSLDALTLAGAEVEAVDLPLLEHTRAVGYVTMGAEAAASQRDHLGAHRADYGPDTRLLLAMGGTLSAVEYLHAQRVRTLLRRGVSDLLSRFDAFASPTVACVAPPISAAALGGGEIDDRVNAALARYSFLANLTGFPAVSMPAPVEVGALPAGLQLMGGPWSEGRLLAIAAAAARIFPEPPTPPGAGDLLALAGG